MDEALTPPARRAFPFRRLVLALGAVVGLVVLFRVLPVSAWVESFKAWVAGLGAVGYLAYGLAYVVVSMIPGGPAALLTLAGGAVFGPVTGTILVSVSSTIGATLAFLLARTVLRRRAEEMVKASPRFASLSRAIEREGGRIVALVRLSPVFPFTVVNYAFGLTKVRPVSYVLASWVAMLPGTAAYVYLGSALGQAASEADPAKKAIQLVLGAAAVVATVLIARTAAKAIRSAGGEETAGAAAK